MTDLPDIKNEYSFRNEALINDAMKKALDQDSPDYAIVEFISELGLYFGCNRIFIFEEKDYSQLPEMFSWEKPGLKSEIEFIRGFTRDEYNWLYKILERDGFVFVNNIEDLKEIHPDVYEILKYQNISSIYISQLILKSQVIGFYYIENPPVNNFDGVYDFLDLFASFIISLLKFRKTFFDLQNASEHDLMTNLYNRATGQQKIKKMLEDGVEGMLLMMDGDHFKSVNDTFGHSTGDEVIIALANSIHSVFDSIGVPMRLGGDEFAVFVPAFVQKKEADYLIEDLFKKIKEIDIKQLGERKITASIGIAFKTKNEDIAFEELYKRADSSLYESKKSGGNRVSYFSGFSNDSGAKK